MEAIPVLTGTSKTGFDFTIFTGKFSRFIFFQTSRSKYWLSFAYYIDWLGDLVSHDEDPSMGRDYVEYEEDVIYGLFKKFLGKGLLFTSLWRKF